MLKTLLLVFFSMFMWVIVSANNPRIVTSTNESWKFIEGDFPEAVNINFDDSKWEDVTIPHTWNAKDADDETPGYYRGIAWYRHSLYISKNTNSKEIYISFDGVNQDTELFINGHFVGKHSGGYTRFCFDITKYVVFGEKNYFSVKVNNEYNENIPPISADFTFFGGIYRDVNLIFTEKQHISTTYFASSGVFITTPIVNQKQARINIKTLVTNDDSFDKILQIENTIISPNGEKLITKNSTVSIPKASSGESFQNEIILDSPSLWSPDTPSLYKVITRVIDPKSNKLLDEVINPLGLRWFEFSADKGFFLNGKSLKLIGTNRHQNYLNMGNALPDEIHVQDIKLIKEMGANFLRVSHYPQDHVLMEMCDKLGIICSVEIPIVNEITENELFTQNCLNMTREMVMQDFNRPSIVIWGYMNEVLLHLSFKQDSIRNEIYIKSVAKLATEIDKQLRNDDPPRYTMIVCHGSLNTYLKAKLVDIPMILGFNQYSGWYGGNFDGFDKFLADFRKKIPQKPLIITEYGADVDARLHSNHPVRYDYTQEYANLYHEHYIKSILKNPFITGANIWNFNDFYSEGRANAVPHVNNKGIVTLDRVKKDTYLLYQAILSKNPIVSIGGANWKIRSHGLDKNGICNQQIKVYTNQPWVDLSLNGRELGKHKVVDNIASFIVPFVNGINTLDASCTIDTCILRDQLKIDFRGIPNDIKDTKIPFTEINVMLGSKRYFEDRTNSVCWIPEKEYAPGSWGYVGGKPYIKQTRFGLQPASDLDILGTENDPIFQTMREGLKTFKMDVPDGKYT
ncbi:MAG TPA: glycoside hydrolase family 2 TIM barrel-domain containing protein, partial [Paludibacter sp.]